MIHPAITEEQEFPKFYSRKELDDAVAKAVAAERRRCEKIAWRAGLLDFFLDRGFIQSPVMQVTLSAQKEIAERIVTAIRKGK